MHAKNEKKNNNVIIIQLAHKTQIGKQKKNSTAIQREREREK